MDISDQRLVEIKKAAEKQEVDYGGDMMKQADETISVAMGKLLCELVDEIVALREECLKWSKPTDKEKGISSVRVKMKAYGKYGRLQMSHSIGRVEISPHTDKFDRSKDGDPVLDLILLKAYIFDLQEEFKDDKEIHIRNASFGSYITYVIYSLSEASDKRLWYETRSLEQKYLLNEPLCECGSNQETVMRV